MVGSLRPGPSEAGEPRPEQRTEGARQEQEACREPLAPRDDPRHRGGCGFERLDRDRCTPCGTLPVADDDRAGHAGVIAARERVRPRFVEGHREGVPAVEIVEVTPLVATDVVNELVHVHERHRRPLVHGRDGRGEARVDQPDRHGVLAAGVVLRDARVTATARRCRGHPDDGHDGHDRAEQHPSLQRRSHGRSLLTSDASATPEGLRGFPPTSAMRTASAFGRDVSNRIVYGPSRQRRTFPSTPA